MTCHNGPADHTLLTVVLVKLKIEFTYYISLWYSASSLLLLLSQHLSPLHNHGVQLLKTFL